MDHVIVVDDNKVRWSGPKQAFLSQSWSSEYLGLEVSHESPKNSVGSDSGLNSESDMRLADDATDGESGEIDGLWQQEERAHGAVQVSVAKFYIAMSGGAPYAGIVLALACILTASKVLSQYWFVCDFPLEHIFNGAGLDGLDVVQHVAIGAEAGIVVTDVSAHCLRNAATKDGLADKYYRHESETLRMLEARFGQRRVESYQIRLSSP